MTYHVYLFIQSLELNVIQQVLNQNITMYWSNVCWWFNFVWYLHSSSYTNMRVCFLTKSGFVLSSRWSELEMHFIWTVNLHLNCKNVQVDPFVDEDKWDLTFFHSNSNHRIYSNFVAIYFHMCFYVIFRGIKKFILPFNL